MSDHSRAFAEFPAYPVDNRDTIQSTQACSKISTRAKHWKGAVLLHHNKESKLITNYQIPCTFRFVAAKPGSEICKFYYI